jgi:hypothetical protein
MAAILDIIGSFIFGGIVLIMTTKLNFVLSDNSQQASVGLTTQQNCVVLSKIIENDLSKLGYNVKSTNPFRTYDSTKIKFYGDIDNNGAIDSITYYTGPLTSKSLSPNPRHQLLYRTWNTKTIAMNLGVTKLRFLYYDSSGTKTVLPAKIRAVKVQMDLESVIPNIDTVYSVVHWEQYINPKFFQYTFN